MLTAVHTNGKQPLMNQPKSVYFNNFNTNNYGVILNFDGEASCFIIYEFDKNLKQVNC